MSSAVQTQRSAAPAARAPSTDPGPISAVFMLVLGLVFTTLLSWVLSMVIELVGMQIPALWKAQGIAHSKNMVIEDLGYIAEAPHSVLVWDTVGFAQHMLVWVSVPFVQAGVPQFYERHVTKAAVNPVAPTPGLPSIQTLSAQLKPFLAQVGMVGLYTAQDTALRLAIVVFALPAFVMACLLGAVDGLVRRDLRKWCGGRESSFVYHHAKATTGLALGGGFSVYLMWPTGGFNPGYMVLIFSVLVAWSLSLTLSSFKKYL